MTDLKFEIDGHSYTQAKLPCGIALDIEADLITVLGDLNLNSEFFVAIAKNYGSKNLMALARRLAEHTKWKNPQGQDVPLDAIFDKHFATVDDLARLHLFVWESLKGQYSSFLSRVEKLLAGLQISNGVTGESSEAKESTQR